MNATRELERLYTGEVSSVLFRKNGMTETDPDLSDRILLAGSFNPLHEGHRKLAEAAHRVGQRPVSFEISIRNVDKPDLPVTVLTERLKQFKGYADIVVTRAPLFSGKATTLPGAWFVIGYDTAVRLLDDRYYTDSDAGFNLRVLRDAGVRFLVAGRLADNGDFLGTEALSIPHDLRDMFLAITEDEFRVDLSSMALREQRAQQ